MNGEPEVFIELHRAVKASIMDAADKLPRTFVGAHGSREQAICEATTWALGWLRKLRSR